MSYHHLSRKERGVLSQLYNQQISMREIARQLGRNVSTISRELKRNTLAPRYRAESAQAAALLRRKGRSPLYEHQVRQTYVQERLLRCWSPEQIAGRIKLDYPENPTMHISHSSIYRWLTLVKTPVPRRESPAEMIKKTIERQLHLSLPWFIINLIIAKNQGNVTGKSNRPKTGTFPRAAHCQATIKQGKGGCTYETSDSFRF